MIGGTRMGFSTIASHLILGVALLTVGSELTSAYWKVNEHVESGRRAQEQRIGSVLATAIRIEGAPAWDADAKALTFLAHNEGREPQLVRELTIIVDGHIDADVVVTARVLDHAGSGLWLPGEVLEVGLQPVAEEPRTLALVAGNGVAAYHPR